jgi:hypothetical protein
VIFVALPTADKTVSECSTSAPSAPTGSEGQEEKRKRGRPKKFAAPPFLDGVEERERSPQIAAKRGRGRPRKVVGPGGRPLLHSDAADHQIEVLLDDPDQVAAEPVHVADAREGN